MREPPRDDERLERATHLLRAERSLARLLREQLTEERRDRPGHVEVRRDAAERRRRHAALLLEDLLDRPREERTAREHLEEDRSERVEIAPEAHELARRVLRRDVGRLAADLEDRRARDARRDARVDQANVRNAHPRRGGIAAHDHVRRREIALEQTRAMQLIERRGELRGDRDRLRRRQRPPCEERRERLALDVRAEDPRHVVGDARSERRREIGMRERRLLLELSREATSFGRRPRRRLRDDLEDTDASGRRLRRVVDDAGAPGPELGTDSEARGERRRNGRHMRRVRVCPRQMRVNAGLEADHGVHLGRVRPRSAATRRHLRRFRR